MYHAEMEILTGLTVNMGYISINWDSEDSTVSV